ncbi:MAG TPA: ABC transporter ATP-binding protein [Planctomycetota bacterium]|nr:ABC transporter ATP-binding protein [Planctomycetota bacterium]
MKTLARVSKLYKFHPIDGQRVPVLGDVSFEVGAGEFVCIMGPSGSGKSTLLQLMSGLDEADGGTVELQGKVLASLSDHERTLLRRETIGHVFQFFNLLNNLNVVENVGLPLAIAGKRVAEQSEPVADLLLRFGLGNKRHAFPHQLSGGEMQRVSIARALAGGQPLLLCDEPTGNLSQKAGLEVMQLLREIVDRDKRSVLLVTHNPRDATFADRILFLVDGTLHVQDDLRGPGLPVERVHLALSALEI